jgi:hypothetical protein
MVAVGESSLIALVREKYFQSLEELIDYAFHRVFPNPFLNLEGFSKDLCLGRVLYFSLVRVTKES